VGPLNRYGWWKRQDGAIRQQLIEHLTRGIMHYDAEFRREVSASRESRLQRSGTNSTPPHVGQAGGSLGVQNGWSWSGAQRTSIRPVLFGLKDLIRKL